jgi:uncharacterized membrane protein YbhN (UPF0104 family)
VNGKQILKLGFGLSLLVGIFVMADFQALATMVQQMHWGYGIVGMMAFSVTSALDMWRFRIASPSAAQIHRFAFFRMHIESYVMAQLLPGHMGVDAYRVATLGRSSGKGYMEPAIILFALRIFGLLVMLGLTVFLFLALPQWRELYLPYLYNAMPLWSGVLTGILLLLFATFGALLWRRVKPDFQHRFAGVGPAWQALTWPRLMWLAVISLAMIASRIVTFLFTLWAFNIEMGLWLSTSVALCAALSWLLPLSPAGVGVREGVITGLLVWLGVTFTPALAVALLNRVYFVLFAAFGGVSFLLPKSRTELSTQESRL